MAEQNSAKNFFERAGDWRRKGGRREGILSSDKAVEHLSRRKDFISNILRG